MLAVIVSLAGMVVAGAFATQLVRQWLARRRPHALAWGVALGLYAAGMLALALGAGLGWSRLTFGTYWLTGALLTTPWLAVGQLQLMAPKAEVMWWTLAGLFTVWAVFGMGMTGLDPSALTSAGAASEIPVGRDVYADQLAYTLLRPFTYTALVVVLGSLWSGVRSRRWGVCLIALGVVVSATSSAFARTLDGQLQTVFVSGVLTAGVAVMYLGFRAAGRRPRSRQRIPSAASA